VGADDVISGDVSNNMAAASAKAVVSRAADRFAVSICTNTEEKQSSV